MAASRAEVDQEVEISVPDLGTQILRHQKKSLLAELPDLLRDDLVVKLRNSEVFQNFVAHRLITGPEGDGFNHRVARNFNQRVREMANRQVDERLEDGFVDLLKDEAILCLEENVTAGLVNKKTFTEEIASHVKDRMVADDDWREELLTDLEERLIADWSRQENLIAHLKSQLGDEIKQELKEELRDEIANELMDQAREDLKARVVQDTTDVIREIFAPGTSSQPAQNAMGLYANMKVEPVVVKTEGVTPHRATVKHEPNAEMTRPSVIKREVKPEQDLKTEPSSTPRVIVRKRRARSISEPEEEKIGGVQTRAMKRVKSWRRNIKLEDVPQF